MEHLSGSGTFQFHNLLLKACSPHHIPRRRAGHSYLPSQVNKLRLEAVQGHSEARKWQSRPSHTLVWGFSSPTQCPSATAASSFLPGHCGGEGRRTQWFGALSLFLPWEGLFL